jgi:hypothetical protein
VIPITRFRDGADEQGEFAVPKDVDPIAQRLVNAGWRFECDLLPGKKLAMRIVGPTSGFVNATFSRESEESINAEVRKLILEASTYLEGR